MKRFYLFPLLMFIILTAASNIIFAQSNTADTLPASKTVIAGQEYKASSFKKFLWGSNYRNVWTTPVTAKVLLLDTAKGGLKPINANNNNGAKNIYLQNVAGNQYSLRSIDKKPAANFPQLIHGTFIEQRLNDAFSASNPYAAATIPHLAEKANIYHTKPEYFYVPAQPALGKYNNEYGNNFYLLEQNVNGSLKNYIETVQLLDTLNDNSNSSIDTAAFIRARLFDMFMNDWDSFEAKWQWGETKKGDKKIYVPVPINRDQAYSKLNGVLLNIALNAYGLNYRQSFKNNLKNVKKFNYPAKDIDRRLLNETTLSEWQSAAAYLQQSLTDEVIENAVQSFPKEIYPLVANNIIATLKARRSHLVEWATEYYNFLSKEVEIPGTYKNEEFDVQPLNTDETLVRVFNLNDQGEKNDSAYYSRIFKSSETKEIRLFGLDGENKYVINNSDSNNIKVKIISSSNSDSVINNSNIGKKNNDLVVYSSFNRIKTSSQTQLHIDDDTSFRSYKYNWFTYSRNGFLPTMFYSNEDRLYVSLGYRLKKYAWGKVPFASNQFLDFHYSLMEKASSITYKGMFVDVVAHANVVVLANYDNVRWVYFFGLGNESQYDQNYKRKYYTMRTKQWIVQPGLVRNFGKSTVNVFAVINSLKIINDTDRYLNSVYMPDKSVYNWETFAGAGVAYSYQDLNDIIIPTKGVFFNATALGRQNVKTSSAHYFDYSGTAHFYIPLVSKFSLNIRTGAETVTGNPEFYQYTSVGGTILRGFVRNRFYGKTAFYNTNDLRFISPVHSYFFNGKAGLLAFFDDGRVWLPGEQSKVWHGSYGLGFILAPFNFIYADFNYGRSKNESSVQIRLTYSPPR